MENNNLGQRVCVVCERVHNIDTQDRGLPPGWEFYPWAGYQRLLCNECYSYSPDIEPPPDSTIEKLRQLFPASANTPTPRLGKHCKRPWHQIDIDPSLTLVGKPPPKAPSLSSANLPREEEELGNQLNDALSSLQGSYEVFQTNLVFILTMEQWLARNSTDEEWHTYAPELLGLSWKYTMVRDTIIVLWNYSKALEIIRGRVVKDIPSLGDHVDLRALKTAAKRFKTLFPDAHEARHEVAHNGEYAAKGERKGFGRNLGRLHNGIYSVSYDGVDIKVQIDISSLKELKDITFDIFDCFKFDDWIRTV